MAEAPQPFVVIVTQPGTTLRLVIEAHGMATIGRAASNSVLLSHPLVSRHHARVTCVDDGTFRLEDLESRNGTIVNSERVTGTMVVAAPAALEIGPFVIALSTSGEEETWTTGRASYSDERRTILDRGPRQLHVDGALVLDTLSPHEYALLDLLAAHAPAVVERDDVGDAVWGEGQWDVYMLHNLVSRVRKRLSEGGAADSVIVTVPGVGYRLE